MKVLFVFIICFVVNSIEYNNAQNIAKFQDYNAIGQVLSFVDKLYKHDKVVVVAYSESIDIYANLTASQGQNYEELAQSFYQYANDISTLQELQVIQNDLINIMKQSNNIGGNFVGNLPNLIYTYVQI